MLKKCIDRFRGSLTARIFCITALILSAACGVTFRFIAWATPISYQSIESDVLQEKARELADQLQNFTLEDSGFLFDRFQLETGSVVKVTDAAGRTVDLPSSAIAEGTAAAEGGGTDGGIAVGDSAAADVSGGPEVYTVLEGESAVQEAAGSTDGGRYSVSIAAGDGDVGDGFVVKRGLFTTDVSVTSTVWDLPLSFSGDDEAYTLSVSAGVTVRNQAEEAMAQVLPYLIPVVLAISLAGALFYSRYITKPIVRLSGISQKMADLDFAWKCGEGRTDEIGVLGRNLDQLSARLSAALGELREANASLQRDIDRERELERQRTAFFAAASHELKTPVTVLKGQLAGMLAGVDVYQDRDKYLARSLAVTGRMEKLVREMLDISRMEREGFALRRETVDLAALVLDRAAQAEDLAAQRGQRIQTDAAPGLTAEGDGALLGRAVDNLLSNALNHSPEGAAVAVRLSNREGGAVLTVDNAGAHIPEEAMPRLFEAFYRVDASRSRDTGGSGLGLYLVKMILDRHGAACAAENTAEGVRFTVRFPPPA